MYYLILIFLKKGFFYEGIMYIFFWWSYILTGLSSPSSISSVMNSLMQSSNLIEESFKFNFNILIALTKSIFENKK